MKGRSVLLTLAALFLLVGGGQVIGALSVTTAIAANAKPEPIRASVRADGLVVREENTASSLPSEDIQELTAQRIELRLAAVAMKEERKKMEAAQAALVEGQSTERARLAALYARMPAEKSAAILSSLPAKKAAEYIYAMSGDSGANILAQMSDEDAVAVSEALVSSDF